MKNFTVKEISEVLETNPETVRRWIRDGRLEAIQVSRKNGNVISEQALGDFLRKTPKYASAAATSLAVGLDATGFGAIAGLSVLATTAIIAKILSDKSGTEDIRIIPNSIEKYVTATIADHEKHLAGKQKELDALKKDIMIEQKQIDELKASLLKIKAFSENGAT